MPKSRSMRYVAPEKIELIDIDVPDPGPGEVQVRGLACGVCMWDIHTFRHGPDIPKPAPPGHEGVGRIEKIGPGVTGVREGQRVVGRGFADYYNIPANGIYAIPDDSTLPDEQWVVEPVACIVTGVDHCMARAGDRIVVVGCGFMGLMILQVLGRAFVDQLIAIDIDPARLELAESFGATRMLNPEDPDFEEALADLKSLNIDTVVDSTGAQPGLDIAPKVLRRGGRLNLFGWNHGPTTFDGDAWHLGGYTVVNSSPMAGLRDTIPVAIRLLHSGMVKLEPLVTHVSDLDGYADLLAKAVTKQDGYIKGVVKLNA